MKYNPELSELLYNGFLISDSVYNLLHNFDRHLSLSEQIKLEDPREAERSIRKLNDDLLEFIQDRLTQGTIAVSALPELIRQLSIAIDRLPLLSGLFSLVKGSVFFNGTENVSVFFTLQEQNSKKEFLLELFTCLTLNELSAFRFRIGKQNTSVRLTIYPSDDREGKTAHTWIDHTENAIYYAIKGSTVMPLAGIPLLAEYSRKVRQTTNRSTAHIDWLEKNLLIGINTLVFDLKLTKKEQSRFMNALTYQVLPLLPWKTKSLSIGRFVAVDLTTYDRYGIEMDYPNGAVEFVISHQEGGWEIKVSFPIAHFDDDEYASVRWAMRNWSSMPFMPIVTDTGNRLQKKHLRELLDSLLTRVY